MIQKHFFAYTRVSTQRQGEKGVSLQEQRDAISRYAQRQNLTIGQWFEERETAAKGGRPVFMQLLKLLRQRRADGVVIHKIDRSARNFHDWADLGDLMDQGVEIRFANEDLDLQSQGGRLAADIQLVIAANYIRNLREEIKKGLYGRLKQGIYPLRAPVGYLDRGSGKPKEPDPVRAPLIRKAFELYASRRYNLKGLRMEMHRLGLRNRQGDRISIDGYSIILRNPFYFGIIRIRRNNQTYRGIHQPLITKSLFDRVQDVLDGRTNTRPIVHEFTFRRMWKCSSCNRSLIGEKQKGHIYYRCHTSQCPITSAREEQIEQDLLNRFRLIKFTKMEREYLPIGIEKLKNDWVALHEAEMLSLKLRLKEARERSSRLLDTLVDRLITKEVFENKNTSLQKEEKDLEERLARLEADGHGMPQRVAEYVELADRADVLYKLRTSNERRELVNRLTSNRRVAGKNLEFMLVPPFGEIANRQKSGHCGELSDVPRTIDALLEKIARYLASYRENDERGDSLN